MNAFVSLIIGVLVGTFSGMIGLGGAVFLIPILVYGYGMDQKSAQGTSIATLLLPIGALAFWKYYSAGHVDIRLAALLAVGFFVGGVFRRLRRTACDFLSASANLRRVPGWYRRENVHTALRGIISVKNWLPHNYPRSTIPRHG